MEKSSLQATKRGVAISIDIRMRLLRHSVPRNDTKKYYLITEHKQRFYFFAINSFKK